jgi:hypothetical protein
METSYATSGRLVPLPDQPAASLHDVLGGHHTASYASLMIRIFA